MVPQDPPSSSGRRRSLRHDFGAVVQLTDLETGRTKVALVRALSLYGCFVKTEMPFQAGARVALRIAHAGNEFSAIGRVVVRTPDRASKGIGVEFIEIEPNDRTRLEGYLADLVREEKLARFTALKKETSVAAGNAGEAGKFPGESSMPRYPWQHAVMDAFQTPPDRLPAKINVAERAIAARLADASEADTEELIALKEALRSLGVLLAETRREPVAGQEKKKRA